MAASLSCCVKATNALVDDASVSVDEYSSKNDTTLEAGNLKNEFVEKQGDHRVRFVQTYVDANRKQ